MKIPSLFLGIMRNCVSRVGTFFYGLICTRDELLGEKTIRDEILDGQYPLGTFTFLNIK